MDFSKYTMQSEYFYNLLREVGCSLACVGVNCRLEQNPCRAKQNPCHSEFISESISCKTEKSNLKEFTNKTNRSCRAEMNSAPNKRSISLFNKITNKFYTLSVDKMLNILNQLKTPHFMLQHDMFICHCEECNDEAIQKEQESRGVICQ